MYGVRFLVIGLGLEMVVGSSNDRQGTQVGISNKVREESEGSPSSRSWWGEKMSTSCLNRACTYCNWKYMHVPLGRYHVGCVLKARYIYMYLCKLHVAFALIHTSGQIVYGCTRYVAQGNQLAQVHAL